MSRRSTARAKKSNVERADKAGGQYLVDLAEAPTIEPKEGGRAQIRHDDETSAASPVVGIKTPWGEVRSHPCNGQPLA